ncbi:MAG: methyltransferase domain-containing protein, partial [Chloroflexota bacterium]|nr:methyltransferase domain-containing protein [Chloroflexota bacterium]
MIAARIQLTTADSPHADSSPINVTDSQPVSFLMSLPQNQPAGPDAPGARLLLICQAEGMHSRYAELSVENSGLTARGWEQTNALAAWLVTHERIDVLVSAPPLRSRLTAQRIGQALGRAVAVHQDLPYHVRMVTPGSNANNVHAFTLQVQDQFADLDQYNEFRQKLLAALEHLVQEHWGKTIAIVLDGNAIATVLRLWSGNGALAVAVNHTSLSELSFAAGQWSLLYANRMEHNPAPALTASKPVAEPAQMAEANAIDEELERVKGVYNRLISSDGDLTDPGREQRIRHLLKFANLPPNLRIVDVGAGNGRLALVVAEDGAREVVGVDISPAMVEIAEYLRLSSALAAAGRVSFRLAPAQRIPFQNEGFDAAFCRLVLHHSSKPELILREIVRLLKPGGTFILADLLSADDPVKRATQNTIEARRNPSHVAARSAEQYRKLVVGAGLTVEAETVAIFERELEDWLADMQSDPNSRSIVREMVEAGLETDATGFKMRRQGGKLVFDQRMVYI